MRRGKSYGLFTTITMIVGIVVGSGIYFRADDIFSYTNGNLLLALLVLAMGSICIIFGSLSLSQLSKRCDDRGGLVAYFEHFINKNMACGFGWFQLFVYVPAVAVVIAWAAAMYTFMLLGIKASFIGEIALGLVYIGLLLLLNMYRKAWGGYLQNISTVVKLIPIALIVLYGIFFAEPVSLRSINGNTFGQELKELGWLSALVPLTFSFDGWTIALHIAPEVKDPKRNMPLALILSPLLILGTYLLYIFGITKILGSKAILELGDEAVFEASKLILGDRLGNLILIFIVISVLGVLNGLILGGIRMPQALAEKNMITDKGISKIDERYGISLKSAKVLFLLIIFWTIVHYFVTKYSLFNGRDISEISIVFSYLVYLLLYRAVWKVVKDKGFKLKILPVIASLGSIFILIGSLIASPFYVSLFIIICSLVTFCGYSYYGQGLQKN